MSQRYGQRIQNSMKDPLELEADKILEADLKNSKRNKSKSVDFLSDYQMARRQRREIPFSELNMKDKLRLGIEIEGGEYD